MYTHNIYFFYLNFASIQPDVCAVYMHYVRILFPVNLGGINMSAMTFTLSFIENPKKHSNSIALGSYRDQHFKVRV